MLSKAECNVLGGLIKKYRVALNRLVAERASNETRAEVMSVQSDAHDWLTKHLGAVHAESFLAAEPWNQVPANYPSRYGGIYQQSRGKLNYLKSIPNTHCH